MSKAVIRKPAPKFSGQAYWKNKFQQISLDQFQGQYLVLFFYPLDLTFVCPTEIVQFSDNFDKFHIMNTQVIGCSVDSHFPHKEWVKKDKKKGGLGPMKIPLLSDLKKTISKDYGCLIEQGEDAGVALRATYIIDRSGILRHKSIGDLPVGRNVEEVLRLVSAFQYTDEYGEVCPAGWVLGSETMKADDESKMTQDYWKHYHSKSGKKSEKNVVSRNQQQIWTNAKLTYEKQKTLVFERQKTFMYPKVMTVTISGIMSPELKQCHMVALKIMEKFPDRIVDIVFKVFFPHQWNMYLQQLQLTKQGDFLLHEGSLITFINDDIYLGDHECFLEWGLQQFRTVDSNQRPHYATLVKEYELKTFQRNKNRSYVVMEILMKKKYQVIIELFDKECPKTCANFKALCNGIKLENHNETIGYANTQFTRICKGQFIQGGDVQTRHKNVSYSIYGGEFDDESYQFKHNEIGMVGMCHRDGLAHTNECQFYVTTGAPISAMDRKTVIFGRIISGYEVIKQIDSARCVNQKPVNTIEIFNCSIYKGQKLGEE